MKRDFKCRDEALWNLKTSTDLFCPGYVAEMGVKAEHSVCLALEEMLPFDELSGQTSGRVGATVHRPVLACEYVVNTTISGPQLRR